MPGAARGSEVPAVNTTMTRSVEGQDADGAAGWVTEGPTLQAKAQGHSPGGVRSLRGSGLGGNRVMALLSSEQRMVCSWEEVWGGEQSLSLVSRGPWSARPVACPQLSPGPVHVCRSPSACAAPRRALAL